MMTKDRDGYLPLPVGADGTPIDIGDVVEIKNYVPSVFEVIYIRYRKRDTNGDYLFTVTVRDASADGSDDYEKYPLLTFSADKMRHVKE